MKTERELFVEKLRDLNYFSHATKRWDEVNNRFEHDGVQTHWEMWEASAQRDGYKLVPVSFLKDINSVAVDEFYKWKIKEEQMPAICEYMQDLSFYIGVEK
ncbi:MAG: hypothetical protein RSE38_12770 [Acinetobacter sp.]